MLRKPKYKKKDLDQRRSNVSLDPPPHWHTPKSYFLPQNLVPGTSLKSERNDDRVPVLLIQRSVENAALTSPQASSTSTSSRSTSTTSLHGWTLVLPQGWAMPFNK